MEKMTSKTAKEWYRLFRALFAQLLGDPADEGALSRIAIYEPENRKFRSLADASESWIGMDIEARVRYLTECLREGERLFLYAPEDDRPREVLWEDGELTLSEPIELDAPNAPKKPGLLSRMLDGDASARFEKKTAAYEKEVELTEAACAFAETRREQYPYDRQYHQKVYEPLAPERAIEAAHDLCAHEIDLLWDTMLAGRARYIDLFAPDIPEEVMPEHQAAAAVMGISVAEMGMVLINYLADGTADEEQMTEIRQSAEKAKKQAEEAFLYLQQGNRELTTEMLRQAIKIGVGMWQGVRVFNSAAALTIGMFLSDLLECTEEDPEIENCPLLERIDMVEARSAACVAKSYATFVGACEELLSEKYPAGVPQRRLLALRAVTFAAAFIDLNGSGMAAYQIFDPIALEMTTGKRRFFARGLEAVVNQYYRETLSTDILEDLTNAEKAETPHKLMELMTFSPALMRQNVDLVPKHPVPFEQLHRVAVQQKEQEKSL